MFLKLIQTVCWLVSATWMLVEVAANYTTTTESPIPAAWIVEVRRIDWLRILGLVVLTLFLLIMLVKVLIWSYQACFSAYQWTRMKIRRGRQRVEEVIPLLEFRGEKMVKASPLTPTKFIPPFQCEIWISDGAEFVRSGNGFRCSENQVMTAWHVVAEATEVKLRTPGGDVEMGVSRFRLMAGDIAVVSLTQVEMSRLQLSKPKLAACAVVRGMGVFAQIVSYGQQTMGMVQPYDAFGYVTYSGSTIQGFSGAPYYLGNTVLGMHIGSQAQNLGYDGSYLAALVRSTKESTQWLETQMLRASRKGTRIRASRSPMDPDEVFVIINGQTHLIQDSNIDEKLRSQLKWTDDEDVVVSRESFPRYSDSGNDQGPSSNHSLKSVAARAHGSMLEKSEVVSPHNKSMPEEMSPSTSGLQKAMDGQELTPVRLNDPSQSIRKEGKKRFMEVKSPQKKKSSGLSQSQRLSFLAGISDSDLRSKIPSIAALKGWKWTASQDTASLRAWVQLMDRPLNGTV